MDVSGRVEALEAELDKWKKNPTKTELDPEMTLKIQRLETQLAKLNLARQSQEAQIAVIGNLHGLNSLEEADQWIRTQLSQMKAPTPLSVFLKGDGEFAGLAFARFSSTENMQSALALLQSKPVKCKEEKIWCKQEQPLEVRAPLRFLFNLKKLLVEWEIPKSSVRIDEEAFIMKVGGRTVLEVSMVNGRLALDWKCEEWKSWNDLLTAQEFCELVEQCNSAPEKSAKGKGQGKKPSS